MIEPTEICKANFRPDASGPCFRLEIYDLHATKFGVAALGYRLVEYSQPSDVEYELFNSLTSNRLPRLYMPQPIEGVEMVVRAMEILCVQPGEVPDQWFIYYTDAQWQFCQQYAPGLRRTLKNYAR